VKKEKNGSEKEREREKGDKINERGHNERDNVVINLRPTSGLSLRTPSAYTIDLPSCSS